MNRVSHSPTQASERATMTLDTSGPTWRVPLAHYDHDSSSWKTSGVMFPSDWPTSSETCPAWGMTRAGELFELPTPALPTDAHASSSLLPTPVVSDAHGVGEHGAGGMDLRTTISLLPTPRASDGEKGGPNQRGSSGDLMLPSAVVQLLPTPTAMDSHGSRGFRPDGTPYTATAGVTLTDVALSSSGAHTAPQSPAGKPSSDDAHPHRPSPDAADPDSLPLSWSG